MKGTRIFLCFTVLGQWVFTYGVFIRSFPVTLLGRLLFGLGCGGVSSASGAIVAKGLQNRRRLNLVACAVGITESFHSLSTLASSALPVYIAEETRSYVSPIALGGVICTVCMWFGFRFVELAEVDTPILRRSSPRIEVCQTTRDLPWNLIPLLCIHFCTSGAHRLFGHVDAAFFHLRYGVNSKEAGLMSATESVLGVVAPPLLGILCFSLDITRVPAVILSVACVCGAVGYLTLLSGFSPVFPLVCLSFCNACTPTLLKALVAFMVPSSSIATAYGVFEASESLVKSIGGILVGVLRDRNGGYDTALLLFGVTLLAAAAAALALAYGNVTIRPSLRYSFALG